MYAVSDQYNQLIYSHRRTIRAKALLGDVSLSDDDHIQAVSMSRPLLSNNKLIGGAVSAKMEITALDPGGILSNASDGANLSVSIGLEKSAGDIEWIPFQTVSIDSFESDPDSHTCTVSGFDNMTKLDAVPYSKLAIQYPATMRQIAQAAAASVGITLSDKPFLLQDQVYTDTNKPNLSGSETCRQVIGWIAEASLSNAVISRGGELEFVSVIPSESPAGIIDADEYFEFEPASVYGPINTLVLGRLPQEDNILRQDDDAVAKNGAKEIRINDNPFLDGRRDEVIDTLFSAVNGLAVVPYTMDWRGNPAIDPGDTMHVVDSGNATVTVLFGGTDFDYDGGMRAETALELDSLTETDKSTASSTGDKMRNTEIRVNKVEGEISSIAQQIETIGKTVKITGGNVFKYGTDGSVSPASLTLTAELSEGASIDKWQYSTGSGWVDTGTGTTLEITPSGPYWAGDTAVFKALTTGGSYDTMTVYKVRDGSKGDPGAAGPPGHDGSDGVVPVMDAPPETPAVNDAYINSGDGMIYLWDGENWIRLSDYSGDIQNVQDNTDAIQRELASYITQTSDAISSVVQRVDTTDDMVSQLSTRLTQTEDGWTLDFNRLESATDENSSVLDQYKAQIKLTDGKIILLPDGGQVSAELSGEKLSFKIGSSEVAYISNNKLYITNAQVLTQIVIGKFMFAPRKNGNLSFKRYKGGTA